jgi:hypothetical protein
MTSILTRQSSKSLNEGKFQRDARFQQPKISVNRFSSQHSFLRDMDFKSVAGAFLDPLRNRSWGSSVFGTVSIYRIINGLSYICDLAALPSDFLGSQPPDITLM